MVCSRNRVGDIGEAAFVYRALQKGIKLAKPLCGMESYDHIVDAGKQCLKVQVKATDTLASKNSYRVNCGKRASEKEPYEEGGLDVLVIHVIPDDTFFMLPFAALEGRVGMTVPSLNRGNLGRFAQYLARWDLLLAPGVEGAEGGG